MKNLNNKHRELYVRTVHDGREYLSVLEIFYYDDNGEEVIDQTATTYCVGLDMCGDMSDRYDALQQKVEANLTAGGIKYHSIIMEDGF
ncbi:hypothetical protein [Desulfatitalea tepidiphila]|uniref:hypothetical protein n=1 Tax=Desulfatitalea tepidiphila TaxID=1185843 RepID=UPI00128F1795|nr:hypothetical protein [Desulfatitalea tepidiphila]